MGSSKTLTVDEDVSAVIYQRAQDVARLVYEINPRDENHKNFLAAVSRRLEEISEALLDGTLEINSGTGTAESSE